MKIGHIQIEEFDDKALFFNLTLVLDFANTAIPAKVFPH